MEEIVDEDVGWGVVSTPDEDSGEFPVWVFRLIMTCFGLIIFGLLIWTANSQPARPSLQWATIVEDSGGYMTLQLKDGSCVKADFDNNMKYMRVDCPSGILPHQEESSAPPDLGL